MWGGLLRKASPISRTSPLFLSFSIIELFRFLIDSLQLRMPVWCLDGHVRSWSALAPQRLSRPTVLGKQQSPNK